MARKKILVRRNWNKYKTHKLIQSALNKSETDHTVDGGKLLELSEKSQSNDGKLNSSHRENSHATVEVSHDIVQPAFKTNRGESRANTANNELRTNSPNINTYEACIERDYNGKDTTDLNHREITPEANFNCFDVLIYTVSITSFLVDIGSDIFVAFLYFKENRWAWFSLTVLFIILTSVINTCFSLVWYCQDHQHYKSSGEKVSVCRWIVRIIFLLLQLGPILRYIDVVIYGCKSKRQKEDERKSKYYEELMLNEDADAALLRLLECFMESAPQLTLQLYIITTDGPEETLILKIGQSVACITSLSSLAWALTSYHRSLRFSLPGKANLTYIGMGLQFVWRFFTVGCRVVAMALFASVYGYWIFVVCFSHWFCMFIWILLLRTHFCNTKCQEFFFNIVIAIVHIFCFINVVEGHTRLRYFFYYSIIYFENAGLIFGWYIFAHTQSLWYLEPALGTVLGGFFLGIFFQIIYYVFFHPNNYPLKDPKKRIQLWVPLKKLCVCTSHDENMNTTSLDQLHNDGQKRILGLSKHHPPHVHSTLV